MSESRRKKCQQSADSQEKQTETTAGELNVQVPPEIEHYLEQNLYTCPAAFPRSANSAMIVYVEVMMISRRRWNWMLLFIGCCCLVTLAVAQTQESDATSASAEGTDTTATASSAAREDTERTVYSDPPDTPEDGSSFIDQYEQGVQAYLTNEWEDCVYFLERALEGYRTYYESVANCRMECEYAARDVKHRGEFLHGSNVDNLQHYELILRRTLCLSKCARRYAIYRYLPFSEDFDGHYMDVFQELKVYPYLYACCVKVGRDAEEMSKRSLRKCFFCSFSQTV